MLLDGQPQPTSFVSATTLRAEVPASAQATPGSLDVTVSGSDLPSTPLLVVGQVQLVFISSVRK